MTTTTTTPSQTGPSTTGPHCYCGCETALWSMPEDAADHWQCTGTR
ncbi:hypothetical protein [Streptomyces sp. NPDC055287]